MIATPDPATVREIAQTTGLLIVESVARDHLVHKAMAQHGIGSNNVYAWSETYDRVLDELATVLKPLTRPDERDVCGVQLPADSAQRLGASRDIKCARPDGHVAHDDGNGVLWVGRERAAQGESDGDVRAVAALLDVLARTDQRNRPKVLHGPIADLRARFTDRIAALEVRDAKAGDEQ